MNSRRLLMVMMRRVAEAPSLKAHRWFNGLMVVKGMKLLTECVSRHGLMAVEELLLLLLEFVVSPSLMAPVRILRQSPLQEYLSRVGSFILLHCHVPSVLTGVPHHCLLSVHVLVSLVCAVLVVFPLVHLVFFLLRVEGTTCGTCMGRTREKLIQGRTGAIIDASRQNSRIQGSTVYLDDSSARLDAHFNSRVERARERGRETKIPSMSTRDKVRRPIVNNSSTAAKLESYLRWAPPEVQVETWECRVVTSRLAVSETVVLAGGCEVMVHRPSPERFLSHLGLGNILGF